MLLIYGWLVSAVGFEGEKNIKNDINLISSKNLVNLYFGHDRGKFIVYLWYRWKYQKRHGNRHIYYVSNSA